MKRKGMLVTGVSIAAITSVLLVGCGNKATKVEVPESTQETKASFEKAIKDQAIAQSTEDEKKVTDYYTNGIKVEVEKSEDIATVYVPEEKYVRDKEGYTKVSEIGTDEKIVVDKGVIKGVVKVSEIKPEETQPTETTAQENKPSETTTTETKSQETTPAETTATEATNLAKPTEVKVTKVSDVKAEDIKPIKKYEEKEIKYKESKHTKKEYEEVSKRDVNKAKTDTDDAIEKALETESKNKDIPKVVESKKEEEKPTETTASEVKNDGDHSEEPKNEGNSDNKTEAINNTNNPAPVSQDNNTPAPSPQPQPANPTPQPQPTPEPAKPAPTPTEQKRDWQPVYRTVHHEAVTHRRAKFIASDGSKTTYDRKEMEDYLWDRMDADEGLYLTYTEVAETVVDKPAWDEQVLDHYVDTYTGEIKR